MVVDTTPPQATPTQLERPDRVGLTLLGSGRLVVDMTVDDRGMSERVRASIFAFVIARSVRTIAGSAAAERTGGKAMLVGSIPLAAPPIGVFILLDDPAGSVALAATGFIIVASFSATLVMGQEYMPHQLALAAAWVLGFGAIGSAMPWLPAIGAIAHAAGRETARWILAASPLAAAAVPAFIPRPQGAGR